MGYLIYKKKKGAPTYKDFTLVKSVKTKKAREKIRTRLKAKGYRVRSKRHIYS